jgi:hypothetical protein
VALLSIQRTNDMNQPILVANLLLVRQKNGSIESQIELSHGVALLWIQRENDMNQPILEVICLLIRQKNDTILTQNE